MPELSIGVLPKFRDRGLGSRLIGTLIDDVARHFDALSLSVEAGNPASGLYERNGFAKVSETDGSWTMVRALTSEGRA